MAGILPIVGVLALVPRGDAVLLARRANPPDQGLWGFPGGRLEPGETLAEAAARELMEETEVAAEFGQAVDVFDMISRTEAGDLAFHYVLVCLRGIWRAGEPQPNEELLDARWVTLAEIAELPRSKETVRLAEMVLRNS
jgi:ADP-ribose pyrophosphatase YjhB (NUDIX family)